MALSIKRSLILYFSSELFLSLGIGFFSYAQPFYYKQIGLSDTQIGLLFAVSAAASGITALILGPLADRLGATHGFKVATLILPLGYIWTSLTNQLLFLMMATALSGIGGGLLMSTENVVLSSLLSDREKAGVLSKFVAIYMFFIGVGVVASGFFSAGIGYRNAILISGVVSLIAPLIRFFVKAHDHRSRQLFKIPSKRITAMAFYAILYGIAVGLFTPFLTIILKSDYGLNDRTASAVSAASMFMTSLGAVTVSSLLRRWRQDRTLLYSFIGGVTLTTGMAGIRNSWVFVVVYLLRTAIFSVPGSIIDATFLNLSHETEYVQMFGVRVFGNSMGNSFGSYTGGTLLSRGHLPLIFLMSGGIFATSYLYLILLLGRMKKRNYTNTPESPSISAVP